MLMIKSLDCTLRARKTSASNCQALKVEKKKAHKATLVGGAGSSKHCKLIETDSSVP
jgi:hypothetical protein